jgi:hypothetical protein
VNYAIAHPWEIEGYYQLMNPAVPQSEWNTCRTLLSIKDSGKPWHPTFNGLVYKAGCP